jgi:cytoplasmic iron level regulating protein YaaA (DUF328/UPF0246 family)
MIAVISPAKTLDYDTALPPVEATVPRLGDEAATLARAAARLSHKKLAELMHISPALATLNARRFGDFADAPERPAIYAFAGDVYTGFDIHSLEEPGVAFAQDHLRILSGLYGLLRPLDAIRPHRLEMGTRWAPRRAKLTEWWQGRIADLLAADASKEYWSAVDGKLPAGVRVVAADFREGPERRFVTFWAKQARGLMARWMAEHRIDQLDAMRGFDADGYAFDAGASDDARWVFVRA